MGPQQLARLIDDHAAALVLYARQWASAPEDVVQEAFVRLAALARPPDRPAAWLFRAVRNGAVSQARAEARRRRHEQAAAARAPLWFVPGEPPGLDGRAAAEALQALPGELREPVVAHLWGGRSFAEIGELMGTSASTAHRRYVEGLAALRERLGVPCPKSPSPKG
jgi:DNA-directed RNA polymerase specialized sigma24 family protein